MKKILKFKSTSFLLFISISFSVYSQQSDLLLNEEFLNSLPEDTRDELVKQLEEDQEKLSEVDFGVFSTMWSKSAAEKYIDQELLRSEVDMLPEEMTLDDLEIFGKDFFTGYPSSFMPISEPSLSSEYLLDIGDSIDVEIFGSINVSDQNITISTDGSVLLKGIGSIQIAGLSLGDAIRKLSNVVSFKYPGAEINVKLNSLRTMQVVMVGYVKVPGIYSLPGNSSVLSALRLSGGISDQGSYRNIEIKRNGKLIRKFDLYDLFINGNNEFNQSLRSGDSVIVKAAGKRVSVYGGVSSPAIYETLDESIGDLIDFAGGPLNGNLLSEVTLSSVNKSTRTTKTIQSSDFLKIIPSNNSHLYVPFEKETKSDSVEIIGSFLSPGLFAVENAPDFTEQNLFASNAYTNTVVLQKAKKSSNTYNYSFHNPRIRLNLSPGDKVIALSQNDIEFINSNLLKDFFSDAEKEASLSCNFFNYLNNIKHTNRFKRVEKLFLKTLTSSNVSKKDETLNLISEEKIELDGKSYSDELFTRNNIEFNNKNCPRIFERDPELLLSVLQNSIYIDGPIIQGGLYPIFNGISLLTLVNSISFLSSVNVNDEISVSEDMKVFSLPLKNAANYKIQLGSNITISSKDTIDVNRVKISGEVNKPGFYYISRNERLSSLINKAGDYTSNAYPIGGILLRESAKTLEKGYNDRLYSQIIKNLSTEIVTGNDVPFQTVSFILNEFQSIKPTGRVITEFNLPIIKSDQSRDIILENGDEIVIPKRSNVIYVFGEVLNPGPQVFSSDSSVRDYIKSAGGYTNLVDDTSVILVYPDGKSKLINNSLFSFSSDTILPGSVIYASRDLRKLDNLRLASTLAPIVSSIAISLASLNSISND